MTVSVASILSRLKYLNRYGVISMKLYTDNYGPLRMNAMDSDDPLRFPVVAILVKVLNTY